MTQRCPYCHRFCTDRHVCGAMARDWWSWNWADEWDHQMADYGWAAIPTGAEVDFATYRVSVLVEQRWRSSSPHEVGSPLWDGRHSASAA